MPFALVFLGLIMIVSGARNTHAALGQQIVSDFTGPGNFTYWLVAIGGVGSVGYITPLKPVSRAFLILLIVAFILKNGGVFAKFNEALARGPLAPAQAASASDSSGVVDHTAEYVAGVAQTAQSAIAAGAAHETAAANNFAKVASFALKLFA